MRGGEISVVGGRLGMAAEDRRLLQLSVRSGYTIADLEKEFPGRSYEAVRRRLCDLTGTSLFPTKPRSATGPRSTSWRDPVLDHLEQVRRLIPGKASKGDRNPMLPQWLGSLLDEMEQLIIESA